MSQTGNPLTRLLREDPRYTFDAYLLVMEALSYAHKVLGQGTEHAGEDDPQTGEERKERHLTGQQLCEAIRLFALEQYGLMARRVLNNMGVKTTGDFGEIVYNLIRIGEMRKTPEDRREDFDDVYDFVTGFDQAFQITLPKEAKEE